MSDAAMTGKGMTLVEELEQAARDASAMAREMMEPRRVRDVPAAIEMEQRATRLRARAERVRELTPMEFTSRSDAELWSKLCGPLPPPASPSEMKP